MSEDYLFLASLVGLGLIVVSWAWLVIVAWRQRPGWGLAILLLPPAAFLFAIGHFPAARRAFLPGLAGLALFAGPPFVNRLLPVDLGPRDSMVAGERHLTLTGWDRQDYGVLRNRTDVIVLQMANPDVTDKTLRLLEDLHQLRELDLSNTLVTDSGLRLLAALPALERLRLANTRITDAGFTQHLMPHPRLVELDLRGTTVTKETLAAWRAAGAGRRALR